MSIQSFFRGNHRKDYPGIDIRSEGIILEKTTLPFENEGVLNPACIEKDGFIHMFYRAVARGNHSTIGYAKLSLDNKVIHRNNSPILYPEFDYESHGLEDPRITCIDGVYYLFYTAFDGTNAREAYAESTDLVHFTKKGLISPSIKYSEAVREFNREKISSRYSWFGKTYEREISKDVMVWEKDFSLFPKKIDGNFVLLHRVMPGIQIIKTNSLEQLKRTDFWQKHLSNLKEAIVLEPKYWFESHLIGGGAPAIETKSGWLVIYHAVEKKNRTYRACAALLDTNNPRKVLGRLREPLFSPNEAWEKKGVVNRVVFPTSAIEIKGRLNIYYGAADDCIAVKTLDKEKLMAILLKQ